MIGKGKAIGHGRNAINYALRPDKRGELIDTNGVQGTDPREILYEFERVNQFNTRCKNKYVHFKIGIAPQDEHRMNPEMLQDIVRRFSEKMDLDGHQWIAATHRDTDNLHMHLVSNRIGLDGTVYDTTFVSNRASRVTEEISRELGLTIANDVRKQNEHRKAQADPDREQVKDRLRQICYRELKNGHSSAGQLFSALSNKGVNVELPVNKKGKVFGIRFSKDGYTFKASEIGREFGLNTLLSRFGERFEGSQLRPNTKPGRQPHPQRVRDNPERPTAHPTASASGKVPEASSIGPATQHVPQPSHDLFPHHDPQDSLIDSLFDMNNSFAGTPPPDDDDFDLEEWRKKLHLKKQRKHGIKR